MCVFMIIIFYLFIIIFLLTHYCVVDYIRQILIYRSRLFLEIFDLIPISYLS